MSVAQRHVAQQYAGRGGPSGLADVLEVLLDKGLVIDAYVRVSLVGIELLTVDARVVVASVDTYLRFAEAVNRLDLTQASNAQTLGDLVSGKSGGSRTRRSATSEDGSPHGDEQRDEPERDDEPEHDDEDVDTAPSGQDDAAGDDHESVTADEGGDDDAPGLLSRIKERGQAF